MFSHIGEIKRQMEKRGKKVYIVGYLSLNQRGFLLCPGKRMGTSAARSICTLHKKKQIWYSSKPPKNQAAEAATSPGAAEPNSLFLHSQQTASKPLTTSPHTLPASRSLSRRSHSPFSIHRVPSSRSSSSRLNSATISRADRSLRDAVEVSWRDSCSVSLRLRKVSVRSEVWESRVCSETSGSWEAWDGVVGREPSRRCWCEVGKGRFGSRPSSIRGIRASIASGERVG